MKNTWTLLKNEILHQCSIDRKPISGQNWIEEEFRSFIDAIDIGTPIEMTVELAAQSVEVITAAYHSAASGQTVNIT